jgi:hypothetical protein
MDIAGPSVLNTTIKKSKKFTKNKSDKGKLIRKSTILTKEPKHMLQSPVSLESDSLSLENSDSEIATIGADNKTH